MDVSDDEELALVLSALYCRLKRRKNRKMRIHPIISERKNKGNFYTLYNELKQNQEKFFNFTRMSMTSFNELLDLVKEPLTGKSTVRESISAEEKLLITLRYLATGCSFVDLHYAFRVGKSTVSLIVKEVCKAIWIHVKSIVVTTLTMDKWLQIADGFEKKANFPHCIGAMDGKHIRIIKPPNSASMFYNYKQYCSMVLFAMCDSNYLFTFIDVGAYGKSSDAGVFQQSTLYEKMLNGSLNIPPPMPIGDVSTDTYPFVIIADDAFELSENLLKPFGGKCLSHNKKVFNYRLSRARRYIECSFGILANRWRIFHRALNVDIDLTQDIIKACCLLHNFVQSRDGHTTDDNVALGTMGIIKKNSTSRGNPQALKCRESFAKYFVDINPLPWQDNYA